MQSTTQNYELEEIDLLLTDANIATMDSNIMPLMAQSKMLL